MLNRLQVHVLHEQPGPQHVRGDLSTWGGCWGLKEQQFEPLLKPLNDLSQSTIAGWNMHALRLGSAVFFSIRAIRKRGLRTSVPDIPGRKPRKNFYISSKGGFVAPWRSFYSATSRQWCAKTSHYRKSGGGGFWSNTFFAITAVKGEAVRGHCDVQEEGI